MAGCGPRRVPIASVNPALDGRIRSEVAARLAAEPSIGAGKVRVDVRGGTVILYGSVAGMGAWRCAMTNAGLAAGVTTVVDYLVLERGPREVRCLAPRPDTGSVAGLSP
jgi:osmotically-inducible protein OsmY